MKHLETPCTEKSGFANTLYENVETKETKDVCPGTILRDFLGCHHQYDHPYASFFLCARFPACVLEAHPYVKICLLFSCILSGSTQSSFCTTTLDYNNSYGALYILLHNLTYEKSLLYLLIRSWSEWGARLIVHS